MGPAPMMTQGSPGWSPDAVDAVQRHRERFCERGATVGEPFRNTEQHVRAGSHVLREGTGHAKMAQADPANAVAAPVVAGGALLAGAAGEERHRHDTVTRGPTLNPGRQLRHLARKFMTEDGSRPCIEDAGIAKRMKIGSADATVRYLHDDFAGLGSKLNVLHAQLANPAHH